MRLSFSVHGDELTSAIEVGTLSFKQVRAHQPDRVAALARELVDVLARGNRAHTLGEHNLRNLRSVGQELHGLLVPGEIAQRLQGSERALYLQVDEQLVPVPWELLHDGDDLWCRRFDIGRAVATPQAMVGQAAAIPSVGPLRMLVICSDPREDLDEVELEGRRIVQCLDETTTVDVHLLVDPTVEAVRRALREHDLVHFAGHADHDPQHPERGGWHLRDGKLTAGAIGELAGGRMPLLVFSNACHSGQTGVWDASDSPPPVYGLANAFLLAGVRLYVGTQWEVVDGQSASFAVDFYEALSRGASAGTATRVARRIASDRTDLSLAWASYVLYGDPETTPVRLPEDQAQAPSPSASLLEIRQSAPWKRPAPRYDAVRPSSSVPMVTPAEQSPATVSSAIKRLSPAVIVTLAVLLIGAIGGAVWLSRAKNIEGEGRANSGTPAAEGLARGADARRPTDGGAAVRPLEPGPASDPLPKVALLVSEGRLQRCLARSIDQVGRFRLIERTRIDQLAAAERVPVSQPIARARARALGQSLGAEITLHLSPAKPGDKSSRISVLDVLTGDEIHHRTLAGRGHDGCSDVGEALVRRILGEGKVIAIDGRRATVNLGWRSRVAPGATLRLLRAGRPGGPLEPAGTLKVTGVELDRCTAEGQARVGDRARLDTR